MQSGKCVRQHPNGNAHDTYKLLTVLHSYHRSDLCSSGSPDLYNIFQGHLLTGWQQLGPWVISGALPFRGSLLEGWVKLQLRSVCWSWLTYAFRLCPGKQSNADPILRTQQSHLDSTNAPLPIHWKSRSWCVTTCHFNYFPTEDTSWECLCYC